MKTLFLSIAAALLSMVAMAQDSFSIIAFGDMPYVLPADYARFENLIKTVNEEHQAFNVHVGDIKSSSTKCTEEYYQKIYDYFQQFSKPLIYTPGDNEWTDCNKPAAGAYDPEERLEVIRSFFFKNNQSFGKEKLELKAQSQMPAFSKYVENRRWDLNGITFGTVHLVGTNNYFLPNSKNNNKEFFERDKANVAWLGEIFDQAKRANCTGIFIFTQADMFTKDKAASGCFDRFLAELKKQTIDFKKPVVLVNGDSHEFVVDKPLRKGGADNKVVENFTRIQVFGEQDIHAVKINISPRSAMLFQVEQLIVPGN
ncbi:hypothetical protein WSM22_35630 [Cytophagales bacterium WSM2-2]|nr:hypothetical protein WSM22_35630 [Cytophagales bacterium WSM2-2]